MRTGDLQTVHYYWMGAAACGAVALWALYRFFASMRRDRLLADTPLAKIRSAAQGYVKLFGRTLEFPTLRMVALQRRAEASQCERRDALGIDRQRQQRGSVRARRIRCAMHGGTGERGDYPNHARRLVRRRPATPWTASTQRFAAFRRLSIYREPLECGRASFRVRRAALAFRGQQRRCDRSCTTPAVEAGPAGASGAL